MNALARTARVTAMLFSPTFWKQVLYPIVDGRGGWWPVIRESFSGAWQQNIEVRADTVLAFHAVFACTTLIAADVGKLRPRLMEEEDGIWEETESPAFSPVLRKPNRYQNHIQFKEWWVTSRLTRGNAYALKERDGRGIVVALYLLDPSRVLPLVSDDGSVYYQLGPDNLSGLQAQSVVVPASEIIHDRMNCLFHPLVGLSPIFACGLAATHGLSIQNSSTKFFTNMSRPSGILTAPGSISTETATRLKEAWQSNYSGENAGKVAVLGDGLKYEAIASSARESQLIEQLKWSAEVVCSVFHMPPFKIGVGSMPTYQNGEVLNQIYYSDCLQSHIESFELCMDEGLGLDAAKAGKLMGIELDLDGLWRMDTSTQVKTLREGVSGGIFAPNEARRKLNMRPKTGGDTPYLQVQNYSLAALAKRDEAAAAPGESTTTPAPAPKPADDDEEVADDAQESLEFSAHLIKLVSSFEPARA